MNLISKFSKCPNFRLGSSYLQHLREAMCECRECQGEALVIPIEIAPAIGIVLPVPLSLWQRFLAWLKRIFQ